MKKNIVKAFCFILITIIIWIQLTFLLRPDTLFGIYQEKEDTVDVLMVGSSAWYTFWSPMSAYEACGFTSYNYAQGGMPADLIEYCIKETSKHQSPQIVAIDARTFLYRDTNSIQTNESGKRYIEDGHIRAVSDTMPLTLNRFQMLNSVFPFLENPLSSYLDLLFYHERWRELNKGILFRRSTRDITKGYDLHTEVKSYPYPADYSYVTDCTPLSYETEQVLRKLCDYCSTQDFKVVFVCIPTASIDVSMERQYNYLEKVVLEYPNTYFLNANHDVENMKLDFSTDFLDETHANYNGTMKFTKYFCEYLMANYTLPNRKSQAGYESWAEDYKKWINYLAQLIITE